MNRIVFAAALSLAVTAWEMDTMEFAYHQVRHGARAPKKHKNYEISEEEMKSFGVEPGHLTPQGMR